MWSILCEGLRGRYGDPVSCDRHFLIGSMQMLRMDTFLYRAATPCGVNPWPDAFLIRSWSRCVCDKSYRRSWKSLLRALTVAATMTSHRLREYLSLLFPAVTDLVCISWWTRCSLPGQKYTPMCGMSARLARAQSTLQHNQIKLPDLHAQVTQITPVIQWNILDENVN